MDSLTEDITDCVRRIANLEQARRKQQVTLAQIESDLADARMLYGILQAQKQLLSEQQRRGGAEECTG